MWPFGSDDGCDKRLQDVSTLGAAEAHEPATFPDHLDMVHIQRRKPIGDIANGQALLFGPPEAGFEVDLYEVDLVERKDSREDEACSSTDFAHCGWAVEHENYQPTLSEHDVAGPVE